jgi:hypothetical protein
LAEQLPDRLFAEVDRRLSEQGARADALSMRAGVMVAVIAVAASLLAQGEQANQSRLFWATYIALGASALAGVLVLCMARLSSGASATQLTLWGREVSREVQREMFTAKVLTVESNQTVLARVEFLFYVQAAATALAIALTLLATGTS